MYKLHAHLILTFALFVGAICLFVFDRSDSALSAIDQVQLYSFSKPSFNWPAINNLIVPALVAVNNTLTGDPNKCRDMATWMLPAVGYSAGANPGAGCNIQYTVAFATTGNFHANITGVNASMATASACTAGTYTLIPTSGTLAPSNVPGSASVVIATNATSGKVKATLGGTDLGGAWAVLGAPNSKYNLCVADRTNLATWINGNASCQFESSPMCTCLYSYTNKIGNLSVKLLPADAANTLSGYLQTAVTNCQLVRRNQDQRNKLAGGSQSLCQFLAIFTFTLFCNTLYAYLRGMDWALGLNSWSGNLSMATALHYVFYLVFVFFVALIGHCFAFGSNGTGWVVFISIWPPAAVIGFYYEAAYWMAYAKRRPFLHPFAFGVCMCSLVAFTLIYRGVTQFEHINSEIWIAHGITLLYVHVVWFFAFRHDERQTDASLKITEGILGTVYVQESYLLTVALALVAANNTLIVPYPARDCFGLHYFLPGFFTLVAFANLAWISVLGLVHRFGPETKLQWLVIDYFEDVGIYLLFGIGLWLFFIFLSRHMAVYLSRTGTPFYSIAGNAGPAGSLIPGYFRSTLLF